MPSRRWQHSHSHLPDSPCASLAAISAHPRVCLAGFSHALCPEQKFWCGPTRPASLTAPWSHLLAAPSLQSRRREFLKSSLTSLSLTAHVQCLGSPCWSDLQNTSESSPPNSVATIVVKATSVSLLRCCNNLLIESSRFQSCPYALLQERPGQPL